MKSTDMPAPDAVIEYPNGRRGLAMLFYGMPEDTDALIVARENGFDARMLILEDDDSEDAQALAKEYTDGGDGEFIALRWNPPIPDGWQLGEKWDTEDGPVALIIRKSAG